MPSLVSMYAYVQAFLEQVLVSVACKRLARWLLMMRDRGDDDALQITQNLLAEMLGVQRPTITNAARELERAGLIARGRRQVTILDRQGVGRKLYEIGNGEWDIPVLRTSLETIISDGRTIEAFEVEHVSRQSASA
jgi:DNA-binding transcriptional ArsR family regulator